MSVYAALAAQASGLDFGFDQSHRLGMVRIRFFRVPQVVHQAAAEQLEGAHTGGLQTLLQVVILAAPPREILVISVDGQQVGAPEGQVDAQPGAGAVIAVREGYGRKRGRRTAF